MPRYTLPLFLSLLLHCLLFVPFLFLHLTQPASHTTTAQPGGNTISLSIASFPSERPTPAHDKTELIDVNVHPVLVSTHNVAAPPLHAQPAGPEPSGPGGVGMVSAPGSTVLPVAARIERVVYLIDQSESMFAAWPRARLELALSLRALPRNASFQVFAYNRSVKPLLLAPTGLVRANEVNVHQTLAALEDLVPSSSTDHVAALKRGLALRPQVLFLVTDADDLRDGDVAPLTRLNHGTTVHVVELSRRSDPANSPLARLARQTGGTYRRVQP